ncbi:putative metalloprotease CJM1_0395 family protein [Oceanisphaera sp. W20_SRM_FM3]|uniref:putative metalloprotease CJM1_0395 family protein n=1 Tax=Oceanisphaera sp. W20_SRM_FM3 TaxID=3240267 RepID=UPI003F952270
MQIPNSALHAAQASISFMPPQAGELIQQDNQARPLIEPASDAKGAQSQAFGGAKQDSQPELYTRQGRLPEASKTDEVATDDAKNTAADSTDDKSTDDKSTENKSTENKSTDDKALADAPTKNVAGKELTIEQQEELLQLQQRDQEVRVHEQQHASVGGQHTGSPSYEYDTGPDGKQYVVEGSVSVDLSPIAGDPAATIDKMRQVKAAALAPAQPSTADKNAAAAADSHIAQATAELMQATEAEAKVNEANDETKADEPKAGETNAAVQPLAAQANNAPSATPATKSQSAIATDTPTAKDANGQMEHRNQVIAGVYGKAAQAQSQQQLLSLA